ncbi:hypothetical protein WC1_1 [Rhodococcus phage WC1]|uniref:Uncharacterized protein n=5 Tax=Rerduovirus TaxID=1982375 RepID=G9FHW3_9CAUD|nr:hypothetical protein RoPhRER2_gp63 [Rhodococcus phage RER2]YP_009189657.1 hypothetical protein AU091_gp01 [Rhodococcus phage CosmicSans]YP_009834044.1 hypothetical protein HWB24_gp01 [Rhodococcus phage Hiro]YP_010060216.1 membrane protein [Rhodococcus phage PhailMary]ALA46207.1 hypothetical protein PBI_RHODALYSA_1 [Rhodococcus phage Rhodalysa]ALN97048.1 hypothetical protein SEA_TWAMP_1 [Rhodococcus phage TWAMP]ALO80602.1 hypothetical protein SEA_LILLIE_1 [Rhodococcus phage Lillie]AOQ27453
MNDAVYMAGYVIGLALVFLGCALAGWAVLKLFKAAWLKLVRRESAEAKRLRKLAERAEMQNQMYLAGSPLGLYGDYQPARMDR